MKTRKIKILLISLLLVSTAGILTAFYLYNKGPQDVENSRGLAVKAFDLYSVYKTDTIVANDIYTGKILEVSGILKEISQNQQQQQVLLLKTSTEGASVNCTMESPVQNIKASDHLIIKGICSGIGQGDIDLGIPADVYLTRCYSHTTGNNQ